MRAMDVQERARQMREALGDKAIAEAAQKAAELERGGKEDDAAEWRQIEKALLQMRGPHAS
ncbi:conserved protein of unknown function [Candidatus Filomicrobium marinum]|uniref:Uncharacterized protein n=2 Tax=Filomicrobium TaxID=119044 RepID=A0A0D6JD43_9HYPH|nr:MULTISPECIES: hypothetical protein [Filomicrobium]MCV0368322.1 hypothetical protein [Filomicrobium sp.]CFX12371.1 conserved protein of unknown function [Candidatus Filomicrobium marinum]CPR17434.1 conserved protein of unknown function [Candidatus Filomicrobium marinum]SDO34223.1 hypothetical protein SAMN04488061_0941 [Filomicrobium insigne]